MDSNPKTAKQPIGLFQALIPVILLVTILAYNVYIYGDESLSGSNQFVLLLGGAFAAIIGFINKVPYSKMLNKVSKNIKSTAMCQTRPRLKEG